MVSNHDGFLVPELRGSLSGTALTASRAYFGRFVPTETITVTGIAFVTSTAAGADDEVDVGIYDSTLTRLVSAGATTGKLTGTGVQRVAITATTLTAGHVYYVAFSSGTQGGTAGQVVMSTLGFAGVGDLFGTVAGVTEYVYKSTAHALPAGPVTPTGNVINVPLLALSK